MSQTLSPTLSDPTTAADADGAATPTPQEVARRLPPGFVLGAATAAYQIEGAVAADGRTPSIWDTFAARPLAVRGEESGEHACDHYHRRSEDVDLMRRLGLGAYRFSVSWPRVLPHGGREVSAAGLGFYDRLVDELLEADITPWATLYHWDLPQELEDAGGWPARETAHHFAHYAGVVAERLGDRVRHFITVNEPWCAAFLGYASGLHAPGVGDHAASVRASHHLLLGHGLAVEQVRAAAPRAEVGITLNLAPSRPADPGSAADVDLVRRLDGLQNRWFLDPVLRGEYPADVLESLTEVAGDGWLHEGDLATIAAPTDFLGVNYYVGNRVRPSCFPGLNAMETAPAHRKEAANGWEVYPEGLTEILVRLTRDYTDLPLVVTENGSAWDDEVDEAGSVHDPDRVAYLAAHLDACREAREQGANLAGYFAWSLMDNFEWAEGYAVRFGLVHVDYATFQRTIKSSGLWYADLLRAHRACAVETGDPPG